MTDEQRLKIKEAVYAAFDGMEANRQEILDEVNYVMDSVEEDMAE